MPTQHLYTSAAAWRRAAMQRSGDWNTAACQQRQKIADAHNQQQGISDADTLADQQLYIQGKMKLEEYQDYLLFKHTNQSSR